MGIFLPFPSQSNLGAQAVPYDRTAWSVLFKLVLTALHIREYCLENCGELFLDRYISGNSFWTILVNNLLRTWWIMFGQGLFGKYYSFWLGWCLKRRVLYIETCNWFVIISVKRVGATVKNHKMKAYKVSKPRKLEIQLQLQITSVHSGQRLEIKDGQIDCQHSTRGEKNCTETNLQKRVSCQLYKPTHSTIDNNRSWHSSSGSIKWSWEEIWY